MKIRSDRFVLNKYGIFIKSPIWNNKFHLKCKALLRMRAHQKSKHWYLIMLDIAAVCLNRSTRNFSGLLLKWVINRTNNINLRNANCNFSKTKALIKWVRNINSISALKYKHTLLAWLQLLFLTLTLRSLQNLRLSHSCSYLHESFLTSHILLIIRPNLKSTKCIRWHKNNNRVRRIFQNTY